jgi:hypothetical protein
MNTYEVSNGDRFSLLTHTPKEWAEKREAQMVKVGCSPAAASRLAKLIAGAKQV